jgi:hypothetical protein
MHHGHGGSELRWLAAALSMVDDSLQDLQDRRICLSSGLFLLDWGLILPKISQQQ